CVCVKSLLIRSRGVVLLRGLSAFGGPATAASRKALPGPPPLGTHVRHIMPAPAGSANGDSWANAASIWQLNDMIAAVSPGGTVYVRADAGSYSFTDNRVTINGGGQVGSPVIVIGVDQGLAPVKATF